MDEFYKWNFEWKKQAMEDYKLTFSKAHKEMQLILLFMDMACDCGIELNKLESASVGRRVE